MADHWLEELLESVAGCWEWHGLALHIGFEFREPEGEEDCPEVWVYPALQEMVGGPHDGETGWCGFDFDLTGLLGEFEAGHLSAGTGTEHGPPELVLEGTFGGREVVLHVCLEPPAGVEATEVIDLTGPEGPGIREKG